MKISIAICTWNRSRLLKQTIESLFRMTIPRQSTWEIVIVDNGSTDNTKQIVESFQDTLPIHYVFESEQGHSSARNTAISQSSGDFIVWTDNDVIVEPNWLCAYVDGIQRHPTAVYFGGRIQPIFESGKPDWLNETWEMCKPVYAARDLGDAELELGQGQFPYGANFAIRTDIQKQFLYDTAHGRKANGMLGEDEVTVLRKIDKEGHRGIWLPKASLQHFIPADRATPQYISRYFVGQGQTNILQGKTSKSAFSAFREFVGHQFAWRLKRRFSKPDEWVSHLIRASLSRGEYLAIREQGRFASGPMQV